MAPSIVPTIPGEQVSPEHASFLREHVSNLTLMRTRGFPGAQPVSFDHGSLKLLEEEDFWVCEKSDGLRVLLLIVVHPQTGEQETYLIDRKNLYRRVYGLRFPHHEDAMRPATNTILDGELVVDVDRRSGQSTLRFLAFDCVVLDGTPLLSKSLGSRYMRLMNCLINPHKKMLARYPDLAAQQPFEIKLKTMDRSYAVEKVFKEVLPNLQHGSDGLIFTSAESGYVHGTDPKIIKWKEPSENSIDFKVQLRFPPLADDPSRPDYFQKPLLALHQWEGGERYSWFDSIELSDAEWEELRDAHPQIDERIVEVAWDEARAGWKILRFRDDKPHGNHSSTVEKVLVSIRDGVKISQLIAHAPTLRANWKAREQRRAAAPPAPPPAPAHAHGGWSGAGGVDGGAGGTAGGYTIRT